MRRGFPAAFLGLLLAAFLAVSAGAETFEMVSDTLVYDPASGTISAEGNVKVTGDGMSATASRGEAAADGTVLKLSGGVDASWEGGRRTIRCQELETETAGGSRKIRGEKVSRFEDAGLDVVLRADTVRGLLENGVFANLEARGNVKADTTASDGKPATITSQRAVYGDAAGTIVFSGGARAVQPGRTITADMIIYRVDTGRIEAEGSPRIVVEMEQES